MLSAGSKPVNGSGARPSLARAEPRNRRVMRVRETACSENRLTLTGIDTTSASNASPAARAAIANEDVDGNSSRDGGAGLIHVKRTPKIRASTQDSRIARNAP